MKTRTSLSLWVAALLTLSTLPGFAKPTESLYEYAINVFGKLQTHWEEQVYENRLNDSLLTFTVNENGDVISSSLQKSATDNGSAQQALDFLKQNAPFGAFPTHLRGSQLEFKFKLSPGSLQMVGYQIVERKQTPTLASPVGFSPEYSHLQQSQVSTAPSGWDKPEIRSADEKAMNDYIGTVQEQVQKNWQLPEGVTSPRQAIAILMIDRKGILMGTQLKQSSGNKAVDKAALNAIQQANPFPPVPAAFTSLPVQVEYVFEAVTAQQASN